MSLKDTHTPTKTVSLQTRIQIAFITLFACFLGIPYLEEWFHTELAWGIGVSIGLGIGFYSHLRCFKTMAILDVLLLISMFGVSLAFVETTISPFELANSTHQLVLACAGLAIIPLVNGAPEWIMGGFK